MFRREFFTRLAAAVLPWLFAPRQSMPAKVGTFSRVYRVNDDWHLEPPEPIDYCIPPWNESDKESLPDDWVYLGEQIKPFPLWKRFRDLTCYFAIAIDDIPRFVALLKGSGISWKVSHLTRGLAKDIDAKYRDAAEYAEMVIWKPIIVQPTQMLTVLDSEIDESIMNDCVIRVTIASPAQ